MKKYNLGIIIITLFIIVSGCDESEDPAGRRGVGFIPVISDINPSIYLATDVVNSYVAFTVDIPEGSADNAVVQVSLNNGGQRKEVASVSGFPATVNITGADVAAALGISTSDIKGGDMVNFEVLTTSDGVTTRSNAVVNAPVACEYSTELAGGSYHCNSSPAQWNVDGNVTITVDPSDPYTVYVAGIAALDGITEDGGPLVMHINPANFTVVADKTVLASEAFGYHNFAYEGSGNYGSCDGTYTMRFTITVDEGTFGTYDFTLTKN